eukprot:UN14730
MRREIFAFFEIASKPMAQAADWYNNRYFCKPPLILMFRWSDVLLINEMFSNPKAERLAWVATLALISHQIASSIWTYFDEHGSSLLKNVIIFFCVFRYEKRIVAIIQPFEPSLKFYRSGKLGRPVYSLREMRIMEALLESYPQFCFKCSIFSHSLT